MSGVLYDDGGVPHVWSHRHVVVHHGDGRLLCAHLQECLAPGEHGRRGKERRGQERRMRDEGRRMRDNGGDERTGEERGGEEGKKHVRRPSIKNCGGFGKVCVSGCRAIIIWTPPTPPPPSLHYRLVLMREVAVKIMTQWEET